MPRGFRPLLGVHLSGAALVGLRSVVADGEPRDGDPVVTAVRPVVDLPGAGAERAAAYPALRKHLTRRASAVVGCDWPLGLAAPLVGAKDWRAFAVGFRKQFPSVEALQAEGRAAARGRVLLRATDRRVGRRGEPHKRRWAPRTWHGIADVVAPLVAEDRVRAVPMQALARGKPTLLETDAKCALRAHRIAPWFKGVGGIPARSREAALDALGRACGLEFAGASVRAAVVADAEAAALEAVVALAVAGAWAAGQLAEPAGGGPERLEGFVYT